MILTPESLHAVWRYPTDIYFGPGRIAKLPQLCERTGMERPLLVTDPDLAKLPMVRDAVEANNKAGIDTRVFCDIKGNPVEQNIRDGVQAFRSGGRDGIIAFGGGSGLDSGKAIALIARQDDVPLWDFDVNSPDFDRDRPVDLPPIIAIPTTAGTGSEVGRAAVVTDDKTRCKRILIHSRILPGAVIEDPELTTGLPPHVTAATGMDALAHNLEAYCSNVEYHPMADGIALEGMRLIKNWLPVAVRDGKEITARAHMMAAASMGAVAFQKGLGAIHALSHPIGAMFDTHHGLTNAVVMPYVLAFNRPVIEWKTELMARYLDLPEPTFDAVMGWVLTLREELAIPHTLADLGVDPARIDELAEMAERDPTAPENPVPVGVPELKQMFENAYNGVLI